MVKVFWNLVMLEERSRSMEGRGGRAGFYDRNFQRERVKTSSVRGGGGVWGVEWVWGEEVLVGVSI